MTASRTAGALALLSLSKRARDPITQVQMAESLGTRQPVVSRWQTGRSRPCAFFRERIRLVYGIPADDWYTDEEREVLAREYARKFGRGQATVAA